jgi:hypothetical protein
MNATLESPYLLVHGDVVSDHALNLQLQGLDFPCISAEMAVLSCNGALGVLL